MILMIKPPLITWPSNIQTLSVIINPLSYCYTLCLIISDDHPSLFYLIKQSLISLVTNNRIDTGQRIALFCLLGIFSFFLRHNIQNITSTNRTSMEMNSIYRQIYFIIKKPFLQTIFMKFMSLNNWLPPTFSLYYCLAYLHTFLANYAVHIFDFFEFLSCHFIPKFQKLFVFLFFMQNSLFFI